MWQLLLATSITLIGFIVVFIMIYYLFSATKMKQQRNHFKQLHTKLAVGQKVQMANGIFGIVRTVGEEVVEIEIKSGAMMEVSRYAISQIIS